MDATIITAMVGGIVTVIGTLIAYMTAKNAAKKDMFVTDRQQLSLEQLELRKEMREELKILRDEVKGWTNRYMELEGGMEELKLTNLKLQMEVDKWREKYDTLLSENEHLTLRVGELEGELRRRRTTDTK
jgi:chromosome segregation ATPase